jgi:translation initiation factor IF-3
MAWGENSRFFHGGAMRQPHVDDFVRLTQDIPAISTNFRHNEQIRISPIFLINDKDERWVPYQRRSPAMAREAGLDLVEVAPTARPPVCRIMDYGKWRYQQQKKEDKSRASSRGGQLKDAEARPSASATTIWASRSTTPASFSRKATRFSSRCSSRAAKWPTWNWAATSVEEGSRCALAREQGRARRKMEGKRMTLVLQPEHKNPATAKQPGHACGVIRILI